MHLVFSNYSFSSKKIKKEIKIVHLSDIHYYVGYSIKRLQIITENVRKQKPDVICITGDLIDTSYSLKEMYDLKVFRSFLKDLGSITKVLISIGNHELQQLNPYTKEKKEKVLESFQNISNVFVLDNSSIEMDGVLFVGYNPPISYYKKEEVNASILIEDLNTLNFEKSEKYTVFLIHTPRGLLKNPIYLQVPFLQTCDLILAGHTHGGMMPLFFPGHFGLISPSKKMFPPSVRGKLVRENTTLLISSGIVRLSKTSHLQNLNDFYAMHGNSIILKRK